MDTVTRTIQRKVEDSFFKGKVIVIYGARQVGKTTLIQTIQKKYPSSTYLNCDEPDIRKSFTDATSTEIQSFIGDSKIVFIDEAQRVKNIGLTLKLIVDTFPKIQIVATGSSSFELSNDIEEPLTGRAYFFTLYPFSVEELMQRYSRQEVKRLLERRMLYGMYPEIVEKSAESEELLKNIVKSYLFKDVLQFQQIKNPDMLEKLLQALALQVGNEVSYNELASLVGINKKTVTHYLQILEKAFVIFRLKPYSKNLRKELTKLRKVYFVDTGIRNALINNLNPLDLRQDTGALFENFMISERIKNCHNNGYDSNPYFWRTYQQQEIDYLEDINATLHGYEFKWRGNKARSVRSFLETYPGSSLKLINSKNFIDFLSEDCN
ncbi:ATP-binding protein [Patescibacteria group bacterium]|nr:ATP-binding protein [Patescibacteria group bacterium]